ncbi:hypothetical protein SUNI508_11971 [Seiridium unicorne]|uniref:Ankyrin repeat protein n=1 Tax=Seiridium unicorne TaxID=138068 RepID=A0ABR2UEY6_9PEZI
MPLAQKFYGDPNFYDTLERSLVEQRRVFTVNSSAGEQVNLVRALLQECPSDPEGVSRAWDVCPEAAIKNPAAVMEYLVQQVLHVKNARSGYMGDLGRGAGADINGIHGFQTPLTAAASAGEVEIVRWLLDHGTGCMKDGFTLGLSSLGGKLDIIKMLLDQAECSVPDKRRPQLAAENSEEQREHAPDAVPKAMQNDETSQACLDLAVENAPVKDETGRFVRTDKKLVFDCLNSAVASCCIRTKVDDMRKMLGLVMQCTNVFKESELFDGLLREVIRGCYHAKNL